MIEKKTPAARPSSLVPPVLPFKKGNKAPWRLFHTAANDNYIPFRYWIFRVLPLSLCLSLMLLSLIFFS